MRHTPLLALCLILMPASVAVAHPHVFVTAEVKVIYTEGAPSAVKLVWIYDDLFSLLLTADLGIDLDGDMLLDADELAILTAAVTEWPSDFAGDLEVSQGGAVLGLGARTDHQVLFENGIVTEIHTRPIASAVDARLPLDVRVFDPYFYVAYDLKPEVAIEGRKGCVAAIAAADIDAANALVTELLGGRDPQEVGPDEAFPNVGAEFADTVTITCAD